MSAIPSATESIRDPGLPLAGSVSMTVAVIGESSLGTDGAVKQYSSSGKLIEERGQGPGVEAAAEILDTVGGPVVFVKAPTSVAASNGTVTQTGSDTLVVLSGSSAIDALLRIEIRKAGAPGTGKFRYCLDDFSGATDSDRTFSEDLLIPSGGAFTIPQIGITATFSGSYTLGNVFSAQLNCAAMNSTDLGSAMDSLRSSGLAWRFVLAVTSNNAGDSTAHATLAATLQSKLTSFATASIYRRGMIATNVSGADPMSALNSVVAGRLLIAHGRARISTTKPMIGYGGPTVPSVNLFAVRAAGCLPSTDLKRVKGDGIKNGGPLPNVLKIFEDEQLAPTGLDDIKVSTLRTFEGRNPEGFYITQARLKSTSGSDFTRWDLGVLMDIAMETAHRLTVRFIGMGLRTNGSVGLPEGVVPGSIDERDALRLEKEVNDVLESLLLSPKNAEGTKGWVSAVKYSISRQNNILQTETIEGEVAIRPLGSASYITTTFGFRIDV